MKKQTNKQKKNEKAIVNKSGKNSNFINAVTNGITPYCILAIIIFSVYFQTLSYGLTGLDDNTILSNANSLLSKNNLFESFKLDAFLSPNGNVFYRPVQGLSYIIDASIGGTNPFYSHFTNLLIHIICSWLLFYLIILFRNDKKPAFFFTLIFAVHPLFNQAVIWLPSRGDLLMTMFSLMSFITYIKFSGSKNYIYLIANIISFFLAVYSKEVAVLLPVIFLLYSYYNEKNIKKVFSINTIFLTIVWGVIIIAYILMRANVVRISLNPANFGIMPFIHNLPVIPEFLSKFFVPYNLSVLPEFDIIPIAFGIIIITGLLYLLIKNRNYFGDFTYVYVGWFILFTVAALFFRHEHINNVYDYLEHRAYMPLTGILLLITSFQFNLKKLNYFVPLLIMIFLIFTGITLSRSYVFRDSESFYTSAIDKGTKVALAYYNRGTIREKSNDNLGAFNDFNKAISLKNDYTDAYHNRGLVRKKTGDFAGAIKDFDTVIAMSPNDEIAYNNRGIAKNESGDIEGARMDYNKTIALKPDYIDAYLNRGNLWSKIKDYNNAMIDFKKCLDMNPDYFNAYNSIGTLYGKQGNHKEAYKNFETALKINPGYLDAMRNLGSSMLNMGDKPGACKIWDKAYKMGDIESKQYLDKFCK